MSKDFDNNDKDFGTPEGYFERSAGNIMNRIEWLEEHKIYPKLVELKNSIPGFVVPEGYFNHSERELELIPYQNLSEKKENGFIVPAEYFENAELIEFAKVMRNEENELSSFNILSRIPKVNSFSVEENYFERSAEKISSIAAEEKRDAKVISIFSRRIMYSAAAAVAAMVLGIWIYNQYFKVSVDDECTTLACVGKKDLMESKVFESLDDEDVLNIVDTKELEKKIRGENSGDTKDKKNIKDSSSNDESYLNDQF